MAKSQPRVLKDLSADPFHGMTDAQKAMVMALMAQNEQLKNQPSGKSLKSSIVNDYVPKKGKDAGKPVSRFKCEGAGFFTVLLSPEACKGIVESGGLKLIQEAAKLAK